MNNKFSFIIVVAFIFITQLTNAKDFIYTVNNESSISICPISNGHIENCTSSDFKHFKPNNITFVGSHAYLSSANDAIYICGIKQKSGRIFNCRDSGIRILNPRNMTYTGKFFYITSPTEKTLTTCNNITKSGQLLNCRKKYLDFGSPSYFSISSNSTFAIITYPLYQMIQACIFENNSYLCQPFQDQSFNEPNSSAVSPNDEYIYIANAGHTSKSLTICSTIQLSSHNCKSYSINNTSPPTDIFSIQEEKDNEETNTYVYVSTKNTIQRCLMNESESLPIQCETIENETFNNISAISMHQ